MHRCLSDVQWLTLSKQGVQTLFYSPLCSLTSFVFCSKTALFKCINSFIYLCSNQINNKAGLSLRVPEQRACCRLLRAPVRSLHWNSLHFDAWLHGENKHINTAACHCVVHQKLWFDTDLRTLLPAADVSMLGLLFFWYWLMMQRVTTLQFIQIYSSHWAAQTVRSTSSGAVFTILLQISKEIII